MEELLKQLQEQLQKSNTELAGFIAKAQEDKKSSGDALLETKESIQTTTEKVADLESQLKEIEQAIASKAEGSEQEVKSLGQRFVDSEEYKGLVDNGGNNARTSLELKAQITTDPASAGALIQPDRRPFVAGDPLGRLMVRDLMNTVPTQSSSVEYARENVFTNNAGYQLTEGAAKPESELTFEEQTAQLKQTAHFINMSRQSVEDAPMLASYVEGRMIEGLWNKQEEELMSGAGGANAIEGLVTAATSAVLVQTDIVDRVAEAILAVYNSMYAADGLVMNPVDWFNIQIKKDSTNQYLFSNPQGITDNRLWGLPVALSNNVAAGTFLAGSFRQGAEIYERSSIDVRISDQHASNFTTNMLTLLVEQRIGLGVLRPASFVKATFV